MRQIGLIETESQARVFRSYLLSLGIHADVDQNRDNRWAVWVHEEDRLEEGRHELEEFLRNPRDERYQAAVKTGEEIEKSTRKEEKKFRGRQVDLRTQWHINQMRGGVLTLSLIFFSVATYLLQQYPPTSAFISQWFSIMAFRIDENIVSFNRELLYEVKHGQLWRLITPAFLHFGILHILFNMMWLKQLGGSMEAAEGTPHLAVQVLVYAVAGNLLQIFMTGNPMFGGMSGVNYGLFAYVWLMGKYSNESRYYLDQVTVAMMLGWFAAGVFGLIPGIANGAHAGGLIAGVIWATARLRRIPFTAVRF